MSDIKTIIKVLLKKKVFVNPAQMKLRVKDWSFIRKITIKNCEVKVVPVEKYVQ